LSTIEQTAPDNIVRGIAYILGTFLAFALLDADDHSLAVDAHGLHTHNRPSSENRTKVAGQA